MPTILTEEIGATGGSALRGHPAEGHGQVAAGGVAGTAPGELTTYAVDREGGENADDQHGGDAHQGLDEVDDGEEVGVHGLPFYICRCSTYVEDTLLPRARQD